MNITKLYDTFPIYLIKNFEQVQDSLRIALISVVLENKFRNHQGKSGGSFLIDEDYRGFFKYLYNKFFEVSKTIFGDFTTSDNNESCWSYASNKFDHGAGILHNHLNTSTINSVYYLNVPRIASIDQGSISFSLNGNKFTYKPENGDLLIFPNYLDHQINFLDDEEYRVSINMEIKCKETSEELFSRVNILNIT
jgi:hypothetical protein